ncbi:MAG TPA: 3-isopropylmalate dehydratase small subunit [Candidatus Omnitrophota bacterium]|nr:3-isopropylmalate dehydratase small subunit [Candidatus Omnitrophota bacterium]
MIIKGKVHRFADDVNTDEIIAAQYLNLTKEEDLGKHCMETLDRDFVKKVKKSDIIVAGKNFGCGSSREHAPRAIKGCGISCVIAESFARIFFRNAINIGLPIFEIKDTSDIKSNDLLEIDVDKGIIKNLNNNKTYHSSAFSGFMQELVNAGGLMNWVRKRKK